MTETPTELAAPFRLSTTEDRSSSVSGLSVISGGVEPPTIMIVTGNGDFAHVRFLFDSILKS